MLKKTNMPSIQGLACAGLTVGFMMGDVRGVMPTKPNQMGFHRFQSAGSPVRALYALMLGR
jgi:hypothetical protein